jgi:hypothetical protein
MLSCPYARVSILVVLLVSLAGCSGSDGGTACSVTAVSVLANPASVAIDETSNLTATVSSTGLCNGGVTWTATPSGGTLTASGLTATFKAATARQYGVTAVSTDVATKFGAAAVTVNPP